MVRIDSRLRAWHVWALNLMAGGWFATLLLAGKRGMPGISTSACPTGLCLTGYEPDVAREFLTTLGPGGRAELKHLISAYDFVLPALVVIALVATFIYYTSPSAAGGRLQWTPGWRLVLLLVPVLYGLADLGENMAILQMLAEPDPARISDALGHRGSLLTAAKSQLVIASIAFAAAIIGVDWFEMARRGET